MAVGIDGLERLVAASSSLIGTAAIALPDRRPPDASTLAHARAADTVHLAAKWLLRGPELRVVTSHSPFLCETAEDLLAYYESLPLGRRLDGLFGMLLALELLSFANILRRESFPRMRRFLDFYCAAVGAAGVFPQHLFYRLHYWAWAYEAQRAVREVGSPMPAPSSTQVGQILCQAWRGLKDAAGAGSSDLKVQTSSTAPWAVALLLLSVTGLWWFGRDPREIVSSCQCVKDKLFDLFGLWPRSADLHPPPAATHPRDLQ